MRCLRYASLLLLQLFTACAKNPYGGLASLPAPSNSVLALKPQISRELYRCVVDGRVLFKRFHLSGILLFKQVDDSSTRVVFQNEMGIPFFDFRWDAQDSFSVVSIMDRLDKPAVVRTLRTDLSLLLMKGLAEKNESQLLWGSDTLYRFPVNKGFAYYKLHNGRIAGIDYAAKSPVTTVKLEGAGRPTELPASIIFTHHKARFSIVLTKISQDGQ